MNKLNDYIINVGQTWDNLIPFDTAVSKKEAVEIAKHLIAKCVEVVYSPCNDIDINEVIWKNKN